MAIRNLLTYFFPSTKKYWMHKPIGFPAVYWLMQEPSQSTSFTDWYWIGMKTIFPAARYLTILRDPRDVVLSSMSYFGIDEAVAWRDLGVMYTLLTGSQCPIEYAVRYEDLVRNPVHELKQLFQFLRIPFNDSCLEALGYQYVQSKDDPGEDRSFRRRKPANDPRQVDLYSRSTAWSTLNMGKEADEVMQRAARLWERFQQQPLK